MRLATAGLALALLAVLALSWLWAAAAACRGEADDVAGKLRACDRAIAGNASLPLPEASTAILVAHRGAALAALGEAAAAREAMSRAIEMTGPRGDRVARITVDLVGQPAQAQVAWAMARHRAGVR